MEQSGRHHLLDHANAYEHLLGELVRYARRVGLHARLRRVLLTVARYRDARDDLRGFEAVAGGVALEAAFRIMSRHLDLPSRHEFFEMHV